MEDGSVDIPISFSKMIISSLQNQGWWKQGGRGFGGSYVQPDFGGIKGASEQPHYYLPTQIFRPCTNPEDFTHIIFRDIGIMYK